MAISHALEFIRNFETDAQLRQLCNSSKSKEELLELLSDKGFPFTVFEFEDAVNVLLTSCQTYEQAGYVKNIKDWFSLFR